MANNSPLQNTYYSPPTYFTHFTHFGGFTGFLLTHYVRTMCPKYVIRTESTYRNTYINLLIYKVMRKLRKIRTSSPMYVFWRV